MSNFEQYDLYLCTDCALLVANDECTDEGQAAAGMTEKWGSDQVHISIECDTECEETEHECGGCGRRYFDKFHHAVALIPK